MVELVGDIYACWKRRLGTSPSVTDRRQISTLWSDSKLLSPIPTAIAK